MPVLAQIAYFQGRRDETPNQVLARQLAESQDRDGVAEIAANLWNENAPIQSDCLKVAMALQRWGRVDMDGLLAEMVDWSQGPFLE